MSGRVAVVVGAEADIGLGVARALAAAGHEVAMVAHGAEAACTELAAEGITALAIPADPADPDALIAAAGTCAERWPAVHALVNCQMLAEMADLDSLTLDGWERSLRVNLTAPLFATKAFLGLLRAAGDAAVVHLGSVDGIMGNPRVVAYSGAKGGLVPLTHVMAHQLAADGIRVNCVARALVATPPTGVVPPPELVAYSAGIVAQTPLRRSASIDELGSVVVFLCSPASSYVTGTVLRVDGGRCTITPGTA